MIARVVRQLLVALLGGILLLAAASPALAIDDPDALELRGAYVYEDCLEDGDVGVFLDYYIDYGTLPSEVVTEAFLTIFLDTDGATQLAATAPYSYVDRGFGRGISWIYFTAAQAETYSLDGADIDDYRVCLAGNPTVPSGWAGDPPVVTTTLDYWQDGGSTATLLGLRVIAYADLLGTTWGLALTEATTVGYRLSDLGAEYFTNAIPNLRQMAPNIFLEGTIYPEDTEIDYTVEFGAVISDITGTLYTSPTVLTEGANEVTVNISGTFNLELENGTVATVTSGTATVTGSPVDAVAGDNTITTTSNGTIFIEAELHSTQTTLDDFVLGTAFDLTDLGEHFGMSRLWISGVVWAIVTLLVCAAVYVRTAKDPDRASKVTFVVFDVCIVGGAMLGMLSLLVAVLVFLACNAFIGYILFFKPANI